MNVTSFAQDIPKPPDFIRFDRLDDPNAWPNWLAWYGQSKFCNVVFTVELQRRLGDRAYVNCCHPGQVATELLERSVKDYGFTGYMDKLITSKLLDQPVETGALTQLYLATSEEIVDKNIRAEYYLPIAQRSTKELMNPGALNEDLGKRLWTFTEDLVREKLK